jgi:nitroreductase
MGGWYSKPQQIVYEESYYITDTFVNHHEWRNTVRLTNRQHSSEEMELVNQPHVFGIQPYYVYAIHRKESKETIQRIAYDQPQLTICKCILIFCSRTNFQFHTEFPVEIREPSSIRQSFHRWYHPPNPLQWSIRQTYMALGFAIAACAEESISCSPIDQFDAQEMAHFLDLPPHVTPTCLLAMGAPD